MEHILISAGNENLLMEVFHRDNQGNFYTAGLTNETENFATPNVCKSVYENDEIVNTEGFLAKYSSSGQLLWRTFTFPMYTGGIILKA